MRHGDYLVQADPEFGFGGDRLKVAREGPVSGTRSVLYTRSAWSIVPSNVACPEHDPELGDMGLLLPHGLLDALRAEFGPQHSHAEIKRLEEALEIERQRVNGLLGRALTPESWAWANRLGARREGGQ